VQQRVGIQARLAQLWQRLWGRRAHVATAGGLGIGRSVARRTQLPPTIYAQRERLYISALQLLDDPQAARHVVAEALCAAALALAQQNEPRSPAGRLSSGELDPHSEAALSAWLDRCVLRLALLRLRVTPASMGSSEPLDPAAEDDPTLRSATPDGSPDDSPRGSTSERVGQLERIADALATLPAEIRAVLALVVMQSRSLAATAEVLGISEEACAFFLSHGRKLLRRALQRDLVAAEDVVGAGSILLQPRELYDLYGSKKATARA